MLGDFGERLRPGEMLINHVRQNSVGRRNQILAAKAQAGGVTKSCLFAGFVPLDALCQVDVNESPSDLPIIGNVGRSAYQ